MEEREMKYQAITRNDAGEIVDRGNKYINQRPAELSAKSARTMIKYEEMRLAAKGHKAPTLTVTVEQVSDIDDRKPCLTYRGQERVCMRSYK